MSNVKVLFFSRGRGYGHAVPDLAIAEELRRRDSQVLVTFASYATGAKVFHKAGVPIVDLALPENNTFVGTLLACQRVIEAERPAIVIAHEEFAALVAAKLFSIPSIFISAWLPPSGSIAAESLSYAATIMIIENPGIFPTPVEVSITPKYVGPILRKLKYTFNDRATLRKERKMSEACFCLLVIPGGASSEVQSPIFDVVLSAFLKLDRGDKRLIWVSEKDFELLKGRTSQVKELELIQYCDPIERLLSIADVVITKGTRGITLDASAVGVPSISISPGNNPIDDILVPRIRSNIALNAKAATSDVLLHYIEMADKTFKPSLNASALETPLPVETPASFLLSEIRRLRPL